MYISLNYLYLFVVEIYLLFSYFLVEIVWITKDVRDENLNIYVVY